MKGKIVLTYQQNPEDPSLEHLMTERQRVEGVLQELENNHIAYRRVFGPVDERFDDLLNLFRDRNSTKDVLVFGFSGHASEDMLAFSDEDARTDSLAALMTKDNFPNLKLVLLNACKTNGAVKYFQDIGVPIIISTNVMVHDEMAMRFASIFFNRVSQSETIEKAFQHAYDEISITNHIKEPRCYCYGDKNRSMDLSDDSPATGWEIAYIDEIYKSWRIDMGGQDPQTCEPLINCIDKELIKVLYIGNESCKATIESIDRTIVSWFSYKSIEENNLHFEREASVADYIIVEAKRSHEQSIRKIDFKKLMKDYAEVIIINEDYGDLEIANFKIESLGVDDFKVIPQNWNISMFRSIHEAQIPKMVEKEVKQAIYEHKRQLVEVLKSFDLESQRVDIDDLKRLEAEKDAIFNIYFIGGKGITAELSGQTLFLDILFKETELDYNKHYYLNFPTIFNITDIKSLNAHLLFKLTNVEASPNHEDTFGRLTYMLYVKLMNSEGPLTLVFDDPFQFFDPSDFLEHLKRICSSVKSNGEVSRKLYFIIFDRTGFLESDLNEVAINQRESYLNTFYFKPIEEIAPRYIREWRSRLDLKIKERIPVERISEPEGILSEPYLGNTINELCLLMDAEHLITEIYPQLNTGSWS